MAQFKPDGLYRIICEKRSARNSPGEPFIILDKEETPLPSGQHWMITDVPNGFIIQHVNTTLYASADGLGQVLRLDNQPRVWNIERVGSSMTYHISFPHSDSSWTSTVGHDTRGHYISLRRFQNGGKPGQQIELIPVDDVQGDV